MIGSFSLFLFTLLSADGYTNIHVLTCMVYFSTCPELGGWVAGGGFNDNNAILNSVDVGVEVGVELGKTD